MSKNFAVNTFGNKSKKIVVSVLIMTLAASIMLLPTVKAADFQPYAFLAVRPNPVGVGQTVLAETFVDLLPPTGSTNPSGVWHDWTLTLTRPDGTTEKKEFDSDPVASQFTEFAPSTAGTWTLEFTFPEQTYGSNTYKAATSPKVSLVVQDEPIPTYVETPLPSGYWERPIDAQSRSWSSISNNWFGVPIQYGNTVDGGSNWLREGSAPNSAHIMWTKEMTIGGLVGGTFGSESFYGGLSYQSKWSPPVIIEGKLFYNVRLDTGGTLGVMGVNLATGEEMWFQENASLTLGQVMKFESMNQHGSLAYLWNTGNPMRVFDPFTGLEIMRIENRSSGRMKIDENGNLLSFYFSGSGANRRLICWNSTLCIGGPGASSWSTNRGSVRDFSRGIQWNVSAVPPGGAGNPGIVTVGEKVLISTSTINSGEHLYGIQGYSEIDGALLFNISVTANTSPSMFCTAEVDGKFAWFQQESMTWRGFNAQTGAQLWQAEPYETGWGLYSSSVGGLGGASPVIAYGKLYAVAYDGMIHCFDMANGDNLWNYYVGNAGYETPYGSWPLGGGLHVAADGKIYATTGEHSPSQPLLRGERVVCVNATTGDEIFHLLGWFQTPVIADGKLVAFNLYDSRIYCLGQGPSATTVMAGPKSSTIGDKVIIEGTVIDESVGTRQSEPLGRFPKGVPAVSDASQEQWMEYVYMDQPLPTNATGVEVTIDVFDANGNYRNIGTTTSDYNGFYAFEWTPDIPGMFTVVASFAGSESYYASYAETAFTVMEAPPAEAPVETPVSNTDAYIMYGVVAIIVAIAVVGVILAILVVRKRP